jgi:hypothetical protein
MGARAQKGLSGPAIPHTRESLGKQIKDAVSVACDSTRAIEDAEMRRPAASLGVRPRGSLASSGPVLPDQLPAVPATTAVPAVSTARTTVAMSAVTTVAVAAVTMAGTALATAALATA